jgi:hypothetical protein
LLKEERKERKYGIKTTERKEGVGKRQEGKEDRSVSKALVRMSPHLA